jgi:hypothetical protein
MFLAGVALAAKPVRNAEYTGTLKGLSTEHVTFRVGKRGRTVTRFKVTPYFPNACGSGGPPPTYTSDPAPIRHGRFSTKVFVINSGGNKVPAGKAHGTFKAHRKASGSVKPLDVPSRCVKRYSYTTRAKR